MAYRFGSTVWRTFSSSTRARPRSYVRGNEGDLSQSALDHEISLAARTEVPVLVTADTLGAARGVARAIQKQLEPRRMPVAVLDCAIVGASLGELLETCRGTVVLEDVGSLGDQAQGHVLAFLEKHSRCHSAGAGGRTRIVSTALTDLYSRVKAGKFREALFYRLNVIHISVSRTTVKTS